MAADDAAVVVTLRANIKDYEAALKNAVRATERAASAAQSAISNVGKGGTSNVIQANFAKSSAAIENDARVMSYQLNDIFSGLATGQGIRAVQQQLGQIAQLMSGGSLAQGARLMGSALMSMVNPINLAVVAFGILASVAAAYFGDTEKDAAKAAKATKELADELDRIAKEHPRSEALGALALDAKNAAAAAQQNVDKTTALAAAYDKIKDKVVDTQVTIADFVTTLQSGNDASLIAASKLAQAWNNLAAALKDGRDITAELAAMQDALNDSQVQALPQAKKYSDTFEEIAKQYQAASTAGHDLHKTFEMATVDIGDLTKALEKLVGVNPTGLLAIIDMLRRQFPDALGAAGGALSSFGTGLTTTWNEVGKSIKNASDLIKKQEGFIPNAKWDVNAFRVGFGSDTYVDAMGKVQKVTRDTVVTLDQANQDLNRRIGEFQTTIVSQIGPDMWRGLDQAQQAALTSIAYNYGNLPASIVRAIKQGDRGQVAAAIAGLSANPKRRMEEAQLYAQGGSDSAQGPLNAIQTQRDAVKSLQEWNVETERRIELQKQVAAINGQVWLSEADRAAQVEALRISEEKLAELRKAGVDVSAEQERQIRSLAKAQADATVKSQEAAERQADVVARQKQAAAEMAQINQQFAQVIGGGLSSFIQDLVSGKDAGDAFASAVQRITSQLIDMMVQLLIIKPLMNALGGSTGGGGLLGSLFGIGHGGGQVSHLGGGGQRRASPAMFANAPRYAAGGVVGLRPGEVPIIAHRGEIIVPNARRLASSSGGGRVDNSVHQQNRISIDMAGSGYVAANSKNAKQVGENMQKLIQAELVRESRPGGLLRQVPR